MNKYEMILKALIEYEENNYNSEDEEWQKQINKLIEEYTKKEKVQE